MLGEIAEQCEEIGDNYFMRFEWFVDEAMPLLCGDDEKADYWAAHGKRAKAEKLMWEKRDDENIRDHYIDCLIEWGVYKKAVEVIDDKNDWAAFFDELWKMPDWEHNYEDAEAKILIKEEWLDLLKDMFVHKHWNLWELYPEYIKYVPKQDHAFV